ncbi:MAG TPA: hypothetical protein DDX47_00490 [Candidatus Jacksonbacteria bacterium]|nr:MAG: MTA/SAH nucleosidase [Parcubacteria group bacterium GW2011_GWC2_44_22]OGY76453.1 MAG: hypothetical protein A2295_02265 [Candidatus Jacksonbacteria bacterium RIFOXYB2_FULL_44_15]OGY76824.1 MAG: hypothetical protein A2240_04600 [Candidatus Jacksonbacteria bacterium RIFOXYA2_FULL_43_12]OGY82183.1 MAG: hypothetical protein A2550_05770 [Candidatus Jacksonbacteria bacterium RIFOXYD2_FULL_43_21]HBH45834.1 hypothetical protein [Candidatus Jacksonbacteria bacterium]
MNSNHLSKKFGIICAMKEETAMIIETLKLQKKPKNILPLFENQDIVLVESMVGKVAAGLATAYLLKHFAPKKIINIGLAGALNPAFEPGDTFFVSEVFQHDAYIPIVSYQNDFYQRIAGEIPDDHARPAVRLTTGDQFIDNRKKLAALKAKADLVDMEGFAIAYVANKYDKKVIFIKATSDKANQSAADELMINVQRAMQNSINLLLKIIS